MVSQCLSPITKGKKISMSLTIPASFGYIVCDSSGSYYFTLTTVRGCALSGDIGPKKEWLTLLRNQREITTNEGINWSFHRRLESRGFVYIWLVTSILLSFSCDTE